MVWQSLRGVLLGIAVLLMAAGVWGGIAQAEERQVLAYLTENVSVFKCVGNQSFKRTATVSKEQLPLVPLAVLESSSKGFVKIQTHDGPVWLDAMDVKVSHGKKIKKCKKNNGVGSSANKKSFHVRGIGE